MILVALCAVAFGRTAGQANNAVLATLMGAVIVTELLSASLLYNQFFQSRAWWLAPIATGYAFVGLCVVGYLLTFPNVFSRHGYFGANGETALLMWCAWHAGFPLAIIAGMAARNRSAQASLRTVQRTIAATIVASAVVSAALLYLCIRAAPFIPLLMAGHTFTPLMVRGVLPLICAIDVVAVLFLLRRGSSTTVEVWLPVAVLASMLDAVMGVIAPRYSIVWYVGKFFAVTSSTTIVSVFLLEIAHVTNALAHANGRLRALSEHLARHDGVTDLPNRTLLEEKLTDALAEGPGHDARVALLRVNLDHFATINEAMGMSAGDTLLRESARRLGVTVRKAHFVACTGGDDFAIVLPRAGSPDEIASAAEHVLKGLRQSFVASGHRIFPSGSIGIAVAPDDGRDAETLLGAAAAAMDAAKRSGGNQLCFYHSSMRQASVERIAMESQLRAALRQRQFVVYYQPIVDIATRQTAGAEALVRWKHPERGLIAPDAFIPSAEQSGLIVPIGVFVMRTAARQARLWFEQGLRYPISVNVSVREFRDPAFFDNICKILDQERILPELLCIEVTETLAIDDAEQTQQTLAACRERGVRISLDDFGTSHACLANVKRLPITTLKIDKMFVRDLGHSRTDGAIVTAILAFAKSLGLTTVAEGVETMEQLQWLRSAGCAYAQGYLFSKPIPADAFEAHVVAERRRTA